MKTYKIGRHTFDQWPYDISEIVINDQDQRQISLDCILPKNYGFSFRQTLRVEEATNFGTIIKHTFETVVHHMNYDRRWERDWEVFKLLWSIWRYQRKEATWRKYPTVTYRRHTQPPVVFCGGIYFHTKKFRLE